MLWETGICRESSWIDLKKCESVHLDTWWRDFSSRMDWSANQPVHAKDSKTTAQEWTTQSARTRSLTATGRRRIDDRNKSWSLYRTNGFGEYSNRTIPISYNRFWSPSVFLVGLSSWFHQWQYQRHFLLDFFSEWQWFVTVHPMPRPFFCTLATAKPIQNTNLALRYCYP